MWWGFDNEVGHEFPQGNSYTFPIGLTLGTKVANQFHDTSFYLKAGIIKVLFLMLALNISKISPFILI